MEKIQADYKLVNDKYNDLMIEKEKFKNERDQFEISYNNIKNELDRFKIDHSEKITHLERTNNELSIN